MLRGRVERDAVSEQRLLLREPLGNSKGTQEALKDVWVSSEWGVFLTTQ